MPVPRHALKHSKTTLFTSTVLVVRIFRCQLFQQLLSQRLVICDLFRPIREIVINATLFDVAKSLHDCPRAIFFKISY